MNSSEKLLTVIVPSYNMEEYLTKCLESLLVPDLALRQRLDVIVVNDGSKDRTSEIGHQFEHNNPGVVRVIDKPNGNYGSCINAALPEAQGRYVKILDADDTFDTPVFSRFLNFVATESSKLSPDVFVNDFVVVDGDGKEIHRHVFGKDGDTSFSLPYHDYRCGHSMWMHALAYRTALVRAIGYHQTEGISYTDQEWVVIPMMSARSFRRFPECMYRYLVGRPGQTVDPRVKYRNFAMNFSVQKSIIESFLKRKSNLPEENRLYLLDYFEGTLKRFYMEYLVVHPRILRQMDIAKFDEYLKRTAPDLHRTVAGCAMSFSKWGIQFHFVQEWRRNRSRQTVKFFLCDLAMLSRKIWHGLHHRPV